jgi:uncharacterized membrane protein
MTTSQWLLTFSNPIDIVAIILFIIVFPIYHLIYPFVTRIFRKQVARKRFDLFRESWIEGLIERRDIIAAAQQTRNLTMVNSVLVSSSLILMGVVGNLLLQMPQVTDTGIAPNNWVEHPDIIRVKLYLLIFVFAVAFSYFMTALRHLGHFVLVIGANPDLVKEHKGSPVKYYSSLINRASYRYTLGVRSLYSAIALFGWLFDPYIFIVIVIFFGVKFIFFQDFTHKTYK